MSQFFSDTGVRRQTARHFKTGPRIKSSSKLAAETMLATIKLHTTAMTVDTGLKLTTHYG
ncbi:hypothetical protein [Nitrosomonas sp. Nm51]|uniref:hypothetical protein n=1 Tax=Nitrosomonas sp. Nm51 TaxID=133720 RepID=UPI000B83815D|nr:hypothetical protein [Nitrosomonas sp. Nm51]